MYEQLTLIVLLLILSCMLWLVALYKAVLETNKIIMHRLIVAIGKDNMEEILK